MDLQFSVPMKWHIHTACISYISNKTRQIFIEAKNTSNKSRRLKGPIFMPNTLSLKSGPFFFLLHNKQDWSSCCALTRKLEVLKQNSLLTQNKIFFGKIHPIVVCHIKTDICAAVNYDSFCKTCQYKLHVSIVLNIFRHLNTWFLRLKIKCTYILNLQDLTNCTRHNNLKYTYTSWVINITLYVSSTVHCDIPM